MSTIVIMPGGFHPFHAGHMALYNSARQAFPDADLYVAATNSQEERPFPFSVKEKLAKVAGVEPGHFVQVKSPFQAKEITQHYNPDEDVLIFVRSEKDRNESPKPGGIKKDGSPSYFQPYTGKDMQPFSQHAYFAYLPTVKFGPGITSATEIRNAWPKLDNRRKAAMVMSLYPAAQKNQKLAANIVGMLDQVMGGELNEILGFNINKKPSNGKPTSNTRLADMRKEFEKDKNMPPNRFIPSIDVPKNSNVHIRKITDEDMNRRGFLKGMGATEDEITEGPFVSRITNPKNVNIYLRVGKGSKLVATDIPYNILDQYIQKVVKKYPQFKPTDFSFASIDKVDENLGLPYPETYEQETDKYRSKGPERIIALTSENINVSESADYLEEK